MKAQHGGTACGRCEEHIAEGDEIAWSPRGWAHQTCPTPSDPLAPQNPVCTVCWLDHPEGRCDRGE